MSVGKNICLLCGGVIRADGVCMDCKLPEVVIKKALNTSNYHYNIALDKAQVRDLSGAIDSLNMSLRYNKRNINSRNLLGLIYFEMGEVVMALSHFVISVNYSNKNNVAVKYLRELKDNPTRLETANQMSKKFNQALSYAYQRSFDLAEVQLRSVVSTNPHFVKGYLLLALCSIESSNNKRARKALKRVLKIDRTNPIAIRYLKEIGETEESINKLRDESVENDIFSDEERKNIKDETVKTSNRKKSQVFKDIDVKTSLHGELRLGEIRNNNHPRYSSVYIIAGLLIGFGFMWFLFIPAKTRKLQNEMNTLKTEYSSVLSSKNATIDSLNTSIDELMLEIDQLNTSINGNTLSQAPDFSNISIGLSEEDMTNLIENE